MKIKILYTFVLLLILLSCKTKTIAKEQSDINYMQNAEQVALEASAKNPATLQPGDQLVIVVSGKDLQVVRPFNQNYSSAETVQATQAAGNTMASPQPAAGPTYIIDSDGNIDFPILGKLNTTGKSLEEFKEDIRRRLTKYLISPVVAIRLTNYKITVLGEVNRPGQYVVSDGHTNLLSALGLAGDLTLYGKRNDILIVRTQDGIVTRDRINLTDASFITSPYYYLKQGDVVYVSANKNRELISKQNPNNALYISIASAALGLLGLLVTVFKK